MIVLANVHRATLLRDLENIILPRIMSNANIDGVSCKYVLHFFLHHPYLLIKLSLELAVFSRHILSNSDINIPSYSQRHPFVTHRKTHLMMVLHDGIRASSAHKG